MYENEYLATRTLDEFIKRMKQKFPHLKDNTIKRRFYDCRKKLGPQIKYRYPNKEKQKPSILKMLIIKDMQRFKHNITKDRLFRFGFNLYEINWLEDEGVLIDGEKTN